MKKNNILYIMISLFALSLFNSCEDDDLGPQNFLATGDATEEVNVTIDLDRMISAEDDEIPATITLSRTFEVDANVVIRTDLSNNAFQQSTITVPAGMTSASGFIETPSDDNGLNFANFNEMGTATAVSIGADDGSGVIYVATSNEASFQVINGFPEVIGVGGISFAFTWDSDDDYDIFYDNSGNQGATGAPLEFIALTEDEISGDGTRDVIIDPFAIEGAVDVPFILVIRESKPFADDEVTVLQGTLDTTDTDPFVLAEITRTTTIDNSNPDIPVTMVDYTIVQIED